MTDASMAQASMAEASLTGTVALASQILAAHGHGDLIWGHASSRDPAGRGAWIKSAEWGLEEVSADRVHLVSAQGEVIAGVGARHSEYPIHTEIYAARPDVGGVVHVHSPYAVALGASGRPLLPVSHAATLFVPPHVPRFTDTSDLILTRALGADVAGALGTAKALFLVNHGVVTVGTTLETATIAAVQLERACRQQLLTTSYGGWPTWTGTDEAQYKRRHFDNDKINAALWDYLVRTLPAAAAGRRTTSDEEQMPWHSIPT